MKKYRCAVIGCGRIGCGFDEDKKRKYIATHSGAYIAHPKTELISLCDVDKEKINYYGKKYNIKKLYQDYKEMLKQENLDIISIATPPTTHYEILKECANYNIKAIFCEKPITDTLIKAKEMVEICNKKNIVLQINHHRRFDKLHQKISLYIKQGNLGKIENANFYYVSGIFNAGSHLFDTLRFFFGEIIWVEGFYNDATTLNKDDRNIDGIAMTETGIFCVIKSFNVKNFYIFDIDIIGERGRIIIKNSGFNIEYYKVKQSKLFSFYKEMFIEKPPFCLDIKREFMVGGVDEIIKCIEQKRESISSGEQGLKTLEAILAFHKSAKNNGKRIYINRGE